VKILPLALATIALAAALVPEVRRYAGERQLRRLTSIMRTVLLQPAAVPQAARVLDAVAANALALEGALPGDARPLVLAGSARLVARRGEEALTLYRRAFAAGERAEIDLNLARAHAILGQETPARAALVRALWVSPALRGALPRRDRAGVERELKIALRDLRHGRLATPPPLPAVETP
jgi:hypothetical protein